MSLLSPIPLHIYLGVLNCNSRGGSSFVEAPDALTSLTRDLAIYNLTLCLQFAILFLFPIAANLISRSINAFRMPFTRKPKVQSQDHAVLKISQRSPDFQIFTSQPSCPKLCVCAQHKLFSVRINGIIFELDNSLLYNIWAVFPSFLWVFVFRISGLQCPVAKY